MKLDKQLRSAYQEETKDWRVTAVVKQNVINGTRMKAPDVQRSRTWRVAILLAAVLFIPAGAYAGYTYLADSMYGSQDQITSFGGTAADYERLEAKLQQAKAHFTDNEFELYMGLLKQFAQVAMTHADAQGKLNPESWSMAEQEKYKGLVAELQPFFDKLEDLESRSSVSKAGSKSMMDTEEFWTEQFAKAEKLFTKAQYADFRSVYEQMSKYKIIVEDPDGIYQLNRLSKDQRHDLNQLRERMFGYLERLGLDVR